MTDSSGRSIRVRLTTVYSSLFAGTAVVLMSVTYWVVHRTLAGEFRRMNTFELKGIAGSALPANKVVTIDSAGSPITLGDLSSRITADQAAALRVTTSHLLTIIVIAAAVACVLAVAVGWVLSGRVIRPLESIAGTAETIASGNLHRRIRMTGPNDELKRLADTFDRMLERLDRSFDSQRRFVGNASHELRTPLAVSRTLIQVAIGRPEASADLRKLGADLLEVNTQQTILTESLLVLARSEQELRDPRPVDLAEIAGEQVKRSRHLAAEAEVELSAELVPAQVCGDPVLLTLLVQNLLHNAIAYNHAGGAVEVKVETTARWCRLTITNTGAVIAADDLPRLFEPFHRLGTPRTNAVDHPQGAGLGLTIAESVAVAHHGHIVAEGRPGGGLSLCVELPVRSGHPPSPIAHTSSLDQD